MKINEIITEGKTGPGLWANIHAKRKRGAKMRKKGAPGAPTEKALKAAQAGSKNESVDQGVSEGLDKQQNYDLTPVYPNYKSLVGQCIGEKNDRYVFRIISAELKPGQGQTPQITYALANKTKISIEKSRSKNCKVVAEGNVEEALQAPPTSTGNSLLDEFIEMYVSKGWKYHGINKRGGHEFRKRQYMPAALYGLKDGGVIESFNNGTRVSIFDKSGKRVKKLADGPLSEQGVAEGSEQDAHQMALEKLQKALKNPNVPAEKKKEIAKQIEYQRSKLKQGMASRQLEETYDNDDEFFEAYGVMEYNDEMINESEYQGRKVTLNKPFRTSGGPKKFSVYVKNEKGNVVKVNFGDPKSKIKKHIPGRRANFRARHNCDTPGPKTSARYWSCRNW